MTTNAGKDMGKGEPIYTASGNANWYSIVEVTVEVSQQSKNRTTT